MKLNDLIINYDVDSYEPQVTKSVIVNEKIRINHWVTLNPGDKIFFKQTFKGREYPKSTASYELYINDKSGGGGTQNMLINFDFIGLDDDALVAIDKFYNLIEGSIA